MPVIAASIDTFVITSLAVLIPTAYVLKRTQSRSQAPYRNALTLLVLLHSFYISYVITILWPSNIFTTLKLPLATSSERLRAVLCASAGLDPTATLPKPLEVLLSRLTSFDMRINFVRFGQAVIQDCEHCRTLQQYAQYALPGPLFEYLREATLIGLLTVSDSHRNRWRTYGIVPIVFACIFEAWVIASAAIVIPKDGSTVFMWHDMVWLGRQVFFLVLPIIIHSLPPTPPLDAMSAMLQTKSTVEMLARRTSLIKFLRGVVMRDPQLRQAATFWWTRQKMVGQFVREDEGVQRAAEGLGTGFVEGLGEARLASKLQTHVEAMYAAAQERPQGVP